MTKTGLHTLNYEPPLDFAHRLAFFHQRAIPGVECITPTAYQRTFKIKQSTGYFVVTNDSEASCLVVSIHGGDKATHADITGRVRKMFDLDTDFSDINQQFAADPLLSKGMSNGRVPGLPAAFDPFEFVVRAILGQQISVRAATTLAGRVTEKIDAKTGPGFPDGLAFFFPTAEAIIEVDLDGTGLPAPRRQTIRTATRAIMDQQVTLTPDQSFEQFYRDFASLKGIGEWTVNYVAMRGLGMKDCFPASDLGVLKALAVNDKRPTKKEAVRIAERWRPYRTYATLCLWHLIT